MLADTLDRATGTFLDENKSPARRVGQIDNRGSHFYLALYWAQELAAQTDDPDLAAAFAGLAKTLAGNEEQIAGELLAVQGSPVDLGGYYRPDPAKAAAVMRPSATFNDAIASALSVRWTSPGPTEQEALRKQAASSPPTPSPASGATTTRGSTATRTSSPRRWRRSAGSG